jgi:hypothetical protein
MSTKTNFKRVALVAVASLGLGVLTSVAPASAATSASAVTFDKDSVVCAAYKGVTALTDINGVGSNTVATGDEYLDGDSISAKVSLGGSVTLEVDETNYVTVTSGLATVSSSTAFVLNPTFNVWFQTADSGDKDVVVTPTAVGSISVKVYSGNPLTDSAAVQVNAVSITAVATCSSDSFSAKYSAIQVLEGDYAGAGWTATPSYASGDDLLAEAGDDLFINIEPKNAYNQVLPAGVWTAQATNGATVKFGTASTIDNVATAPGSFSFATVTAGPANVAIRVTPKDAAVGGSTVVSITYNGVEVTSKTLTFLGEAAKIVVAANAVGKVGGQGMVWYTLQDAAGNTVPGSVTGDSTTFGPRVSNVENIASALQDSAVDSDTVNGIPVSGFFGGATKIGVLRTTCTEAGGSGTATVTLKHTSAVNGNALTLPVTISCAGGINTYTASMDKATYKVGDVATLTITAKDSKGNAVNDFTYLNSSVKPDITAGGASLTQATATSDIFGILNALPSGTKTYKLQMTTAGAFNAVVNLPGATTSSLTVAYTVTSGGTSLEDVLKAIVSLIASINKQIAALQKALLKKK